MIGALALTVLIFVSAVLPLFTNAVSSLQIMRLHDEVTPRGTGNPLQTALLAPAGGEAIRARYSSAQTTSTDVSYANIAAPRA